jgi:uncharacterized protein
MNENRINFKSGDLTLEGLFALGTANKGAVLAHPHPMMGGNMRDNVLMALAEAFNDAGYSTLRFNFRGTGRSEGFFDDGHGEQEDLKSAVNFLKSMGQKEVVLAGYSFGAWVSFQAAMTDGISDVILVAPPLAEMGFDFAAPGSRVGLAICGDSDPFCPAGDLRDYADANGFKMAIVEGADHFFFGRERDLIEIVSGYLGTVKNG